MKSKKLQSDTSNSSKALKRGNAPAGPYYNWSKTDKHQITAFPMGMPLNGFDLGYIALTHDEVPITSADRKPCQSMMIILLSDMLDVFFELTQNKSQQDF